VTITLALAGDTMLGRGVAERLASAAPASLVAPEVVATARQADLFVLNLECCISERGSRWPAPGKPFFFRAPPSAIEVLLHLGVDCVTLANNHALDFGEDALLDTFGHLDRAGIRWVGAGPDLDRARAPQVLEAKGHRLAVVGVTDHPSDYAATPSRPGVAYADLRAGAPSWLLEAIRSADADVAMVTPHWGPNMVPEPVAHVRRTAAMLVEAGTSLVAGHSAHVFHGVQDRVLFDLGDFLDDYAVDPGLRNDLGVLWLVEVDRDGPVRIEGLPIALDFCYTRVADEEETAWIRRRLTDACAPFGTTVSEYGGRLLIESESSVVAPS
jgi:poly-gamma-glutamate capsule biosynthesis protein CapA/YwtB (metallophosphatase superfamily)